MCTAGRVLCVCTQLRRRHLSSSVYVRSGELQADGGSRQSENRVADCSALSNSSLKLRTALLLCRGVAGRDNDGHSVCVCGPTWTADGGTIGTALMWLQ